jgi:dCMP deaminase
MNVNQWNKVFMHWAEDLASMSKDPKMKVGCVVTSVDRRHIFAIGYNGGAIGDDNKRESMETGASGYICAECNAFIKNTQPSYVKKIVYVTHKPCSKCAKIIVNDQGVVEVYYRNYYKSKSSSIFRKAGIKLCQI